ncbi:hypothetical protein [Aeromonas phage AerS_266]|nr:hypothetical protein [Aeromonas phage AerS_266]
MEKLLTNFKPPETLTFCFYVDEEDEDLLHVVASGICALIAHSRDNPDTSIDNIFSLDIASFAMGEMLADCYGSVANFEKEYSICNQTLRDIMEMQGTLLNDVITTSEGVSMCLYQVKPKMIIIILQEGLQPEPNSSLMGLYATIDNYVNYTNIVGLPPDLNYV